MKFVTLSSMVLLLTCVVGSVSALESKGVVSVEGRIFFEDELDPKQKGSSFSVSFNPEVYGESDNGRHSFAFSPFARIDQFDDERSHYDIRELAWLYIERSWELRLGIRKVFWGVTESQHLVDIVNQTDLVEDLDGEDKLGQPMVNLALIQNWGTVDLFVLPYFRDRTFSGEKGRLRSHPYVDVDQAGYESDDEENHIDYAIRWAHSIDVFDLGVSYFKGTSRDPNLLPGQNNGEPVLVPHYPQIEQIGLDAQATLDAWLWKLEAIHRKYKSDDYNAFTAGFEYTFYGVFETVADVGVIYELLYDDRGNDATTPFEDDSMFGMRLAFNDVSSTDLLAGLILDHEGDAQALNVEASRRIDSHWKVNFIMRGYLNVDEADALYSFRNDDYAQVELLYYF